MTKPLNRSDVEKMQDRDEEHLAQEHGLTRVTAYVAGPAKKKVAQTAEARRNAEMRARRKEAGLVSCYVPRDRAEAIKAAKDFETWLESVLAQAIPEPKIIEVEKVVEVVRIDTFKLDRATAEIAEHKAALERERQLREAIYDMSLLDRLLGRWP